MADSDRVSAYLQKDLWGEQPHPIWLCATLSITRNLQRFLFPNKLDDDQRVQIMGLIGNELTQLSLLQSPEIFKMEECSALDKELLFEHFLSSHPYTHLQKGEAFVLDRSEQFLGSINLADHLQLSILSYSEDLEEGWRRLTALEAAIGAKLQFAFSKTFGYLTAEPAQSGTAFHARSFLQIPAILSLGQLDSICEKHKTEEVSIHGLTGSSTDFIGNLVVVANTYTLGVTEEAILTEVRNFATHLLIEEKGLRSRLQREQPVHIKDQVYRAFGLLKNAYQLETAETLNALSWIKLGLDIGWITGHANGHVTTAFFNSRRAHLQQTHQASIAQEDLARERASYLRSQLQNLALA